MLVETKDPERFGRCVDSAWIALNQCPRRSIVAFIHEVETALDHFSSDRGGEAGRRGRWWRVETPQRLEKARVGV